MGDVKGGEVEQSEVALPLFGESYQIEGKGKAVVQDIGDCSVEVTSQRRKHIARMQELYTGRNLVCYPTHEKWKRAETRDRCRRRWKKCVVDSSMNAAWSYNRSNTHA